MIEGKGRETKFFSEALPAEERNPRYLPWVAFLFKQKKKKSLIGQKQPFLITTR